MKLRLLTLLLAVMTSVGVAAQDSATYVVERYLRMMAAERLPKDSLLVMQTTITFRPKADTVTMRRYYQADGMMRIEVWQSDTLTFGLCTNGTTRYRRYSPVLGWWDDVSPDDFDNDLQPYDFRGPLYHWQQRDIALSWVGHRTLDGHPMQVVRADQDGRFTRLYFFDPNNGLPVLVLESEELMEQKSHRKFIANPIDFKFFHEYQPIGESLVASEESFQRDSVLTIMRTTAHFEPRNNLLFNRD